MDRQSRVFDWIDVFASISFILILVFVLILSLKYWTSHILFVEGIQDQAFSVAMLIAIVTVIAQWIEGRAKSIIKDIQRIQGGRINGRKN